MSKRSYSDETKAAVLAALLQGQAVSKVAEEYNIPKGTIKSWKQRELKDHLQPVAPQKKEEIADLLIEYLRETMRTLIAQAKHARKEKWLEQQEASQFAVMHGVQTDKAIRLLEAMGRAAND